MRGGGRMGRPGLEPRKKELVLALALSNSLDVKRSLLIPGKGIDTEPLVFIAYINNS